MTDKPRLSGAIEDFLLHRRAEGRSPGTIKNDRMVLRRLLTTVGDLYVSSIGERQVNTHLAAAAASRSTRTLGIDYATLSSFFAWAVRNRLIGRFSNPMEGRKAPRFHEREHELVPMKDFPRLLAAAEDHHLRDRVVVAIGLYLFLRGSEVASLKIGDVRLDERRIHVKMWKTKENDVMPIVPELDRELRPWLTYYAQEQGPLDPAWHLVPAKKTAPMRRHPTAGKFVGPDDPAALSPTRPIVKIEQVPQRALAAIGFRLREETGESRREGMHTLRRSGARARYDTLEHRGHDGAIRHVQTLLHHKTMAQTERYIGLTLDRKKRDDLMLDGSPFFDYGDNVVELASRMAGGSRADDARSGRGEQGG